MRKFLRAAVCIIAAAVILCFAGCSREVETIRGKWEAKNGYTVIITETAFEAFDENGEHVLAQGAVPYVWKQDAINGDTLSLVFGGVEYPIFDSYLTEDTLKLTYTEEFREYTGAAYSGSIRLYRIK